MTRRLVVVLALGIAGSVMVAGQEAPTIDPGVAAAVKNLNDFKKNCKMAELGTMVTDDMLVIHADGRTENKKQYLDSSSKCTFEDIRLDIKNARIYGEVAIVSGDMPFKIKNGPSLSFLTTQVYVKRQGKWLFALQHSTDLSRYKAPQAPGR